MTENRRNEIKKVVDDVLSSNNITKTPYKFIGNIFEKENISLIAVNDFSDNVEGWLQSIKDKFYVFYNTNKIIERQHFTLAHELGHYFLQHIVNGCHIDNSESLMDNRNDIEVEANNFAAMLLLPQTLIIKDFNDIMTYNRAIIEPNIPLYISNKGYSYRNWKIIVGKLCKKYQVSEEMLCYRLAELDLIINDLYT